MKKLIAMTALGIVATLVGCKSIPSQEQMYASAYAIGASTGMVANMTKIDDTSRNAVIDIVNIVDSCIPQTNETFTTAWTPIAQAHVDRLVENGKINKAQGVLIMDTFTVAVHGIDYLVNIRYPEVRNYQELTEAAVHGFTGGFLITFKPANSVTFAAAPVTIDKDAYNYLMSVTKKTK